MNESNRNLPTGFREGTGEALPHPDLGPLPQDWQVVRLGEIAEVKYGKANPNDSGSIPIVGSGGIFANTSTPLVTHPTLVIGRKGTAGKVWLFLSPCYPSDTTFYLHWKKEIDVSFVFYFLNLRPLSGEHAKTTLPSLQKPYLENTSIPLPPLPEQRAIVHVLTTIQRAIEATEQVIAAARELKKSLMRHLFTYGPVPVGAQHAVPQRETEIGPIPAHWQVVRLGEIAEVKYGKANPNDSGSIPIVGSGGIFANTSTPLVTHPTLVIGRKGTAGKVWLFLSPCYPSDTTFYLHWKKEIDVSFVFHFLNLRPLSGEQAKTTLPSLQKPYLENTSVPLPPLSEQRAIADMLGAVDAKIRAEEGRQAALQSLFRSMLHHLMTARVRLPHEFISQFEGKQ